MADGNEPVPTTCYDPTRSVCERDVWSTRFLDAYRRDGLVIEKTVGNTLRVPFVHELVPDAVFVHIVRDGVDVVESARREWHAPTDWSYLRGKARHFPLRLVPTYGAKFVANATWRRARTGAPTDLGTRYPGIDDDLRCEGLEVVCARQWRECVVRATEDLQASHAEVVDVRFEDLVASPEGTLTRVVEQLDLPPRMAAYMKLQVGSSVARSETAGVRSPRSTLRRWTWKSDTNLRSWGMPAPEADRSDGPWLLRNRTSPSAKSRRWSG